MKRMWNLLRYGKWKNKLSVQMMMMILATNLLFLSITFFFLYESIGNVLKKNYEEANVKRFQQAEYNIASLCKEIEDISVRLSAKSYLNHVAENRNDLSFKERIMYLKETIDTLKNEISYYNYIESIIVCGQNGMILVCEKANHKTNYYYAKEYVIDGYDSTGIYEKVKNNGLQLHWYGGCNMEDLGIKVDESEKDEYYVIAARNIMSGKGQLLINISMEYFLDIFYANSQGTEENIYVLDDNDCIIASKYLDSIGRQKDFEGGETIQEGIERYVEEHDQKEIQIMQYQLPAMGWKLVSETLVEEITQERVYLRNVLLTAGVMSAVISVSVSAMWIIWLIRPLQHLTTATKRVGEGELGYTIEILPQNEIGTLTEQFNRMSMELQKMFLENQRKEAEKRNFEMESLRAQINPHLIYNTLNTIKWMAIVNHENGIAGSITLLAEFLEPVFKGKDSMCRIREELDYVKKYIDIMNLRVMGGYVLKIEVPQQYMDFKMIRFLLQPIVENAILHGMEGRISGEISISMRTEEEDCYLQIRDDGNGIDEAILKQLTHESGWVKSAMKDGGVGIINVNRRIKNQYGDAYGLMIENGKEKGTIVTLKIPLESDENKI